LYNCYSCGGRRAVANLRRPPVFERDCPTCPGSSGCISGPARQPRTGTPFRLEGLGPWCWQGDRAPLRIALLAIKKSGVPHGSDAYATAFIGNLGAQLGSFVAVCTEETELDQLIAIQRPLELFEKSWSESGFSGLERGFEPLTKTAKVGFLCAGERKVVHGKNPNLELRKAGRRKLSFLSSSVPDSKRVEIIQFQFAPLPRWQISEVEVAEMGAVQREDFKALAGEHASHLVVATFRQDELRCRWI